MSVRRSLVALAILAAVVAPTTLPAADAPAAEIDATNATPAATTSRVPTSLVERASYLFGYQIGEQIGAQGDDIDVNMVMRGQREALEGQEPVLSPAVIQTTQQEWRAFIQGRQKEEQARKAEEDKVSGTKNQEAGKKYLDENGKRPGVTTTPSGLQYEVLTQGTGEKPGPTDTVTVHYHGTLIDGTVFDSSVKRGTPATFPLDRVIKGWTEGLQLMKTGSKYRFTIPSELAYGSRSAGPVIGPNSTLIFDVELISLAH